MQIARTHAQTHRTRTTRDNRKTWLGQMRIAHRKTWLDQKRNRKTMTQHYAHNSRTNRVTWQSQHNGATIHATHRTRTTRDNRKTWLGQMTIAHRKTWQRKQWRNITRTIIASIEQKDNRKTMTHAMCTSQKTLERMAVAKQWHNNVFWCWLIRCHGPRNFVTKTHLED